MINDIKLKIPISIIYILIGIFAFYKFGPLLTSFIVIIPLLFVFNKPIYIFYICFVSIYILDWLSGKLGFLPRQLTWLPEIVSIALVPYIIRLFKGKKAVKEILFFGFLLIFASVSYFLNSDTINFAIFGAGIRNYFKFIPIFLLPFILDQDQYRYIKIKFPKIIFLITLAQIPVTLVQRFIIYSSSGSGDPIGGTLGANASGLLSQFIFFTIALIIAKMLTKKIRKQEFLLLFIALMIPVVLNETKITLLLLIGLGITYYLFSKNEKLFNKIIIIIISIIGVMLFIKVYTVIFRARTLERSLQYFINPVDTIYDRWYTKSGKLNRIPAIIFAFSHITTNIYNAIFGIGIGNASHSFFNSAIGTYYKKYSTLGIDGIYLARHIWEWGIAGTILWLTFFANLFRKSLIIEDKQYLYWYIGVFSVFIIGSIYNGNILTNSLGFYFWFLSGIISREYYDQKKSINN